MMDETQQAILDRIAHDPVVIARGQVVRALDRFIRWPWSRRRRIALLTAIDQMHDAFVNRMVASSSAAAVKVLDRLETVRAQQGRHEQRIAMLERERSRTVGDAE